MCIPFILSQATPGYTEYWINKAVNPRYHANIHKLRKENRNPHLHFASLTDFQYKLYKEKDSKIKKFWINLIMNKAFEHLKKVNFPLSIKPLKFTVVDVLINS